MMDMVRTSERHPRPRIIANLAVSADGKLDSTQREGAGFSSRLDRDRLDQLRATADAVVVGAGTIRHENPPMNIKDPGRRHQRLQAGLAEDLIVVVVSGSGNIPADAKFLKQPASARLLAVPESLDNAALSPLNAAISSGELEVWRGGQKRVDIRSLVQELGRRGCQMVLLEGGGELLAAFLEHDLLDELHLTVCPTLVGGRTAPTPVDGDGWPLAQRKPLRLVRVEQGGEELFLHYEVERPAFDPLPFERRERATGPIPIRK